MVMNVVRVYKTIERMYRNHFELIFKGRGDADLSSFEFLNNFPTFERSNITKFLHSHDALSVSDFDFEMVPNRNLTPEQSHKLVVLSYITLLWLQSVLEDEIEMSQRARLLNMQYTKDIKGQRATCSRNCRKRLNCYPLIIP